MKKTFSKTCKCINCGNEAELDLTCTREEYSNLTAQSAGKDTAAKKERIKASGVCLNCGNEADMWIDS